MDIRTTNIVHCNNCGSTAFSQLASSIDFEYGTCENEFKFIRCSDCCLVYLRTRPDVTELSVIYPKDYIPHRFNEHLGPLISRLRNFVQKRKVRSIAPYAHPGAVIVDVGPGSGELLRILRDLGDPTWRLYGIDFADEAIENVNRLGLETVKARFEEVEWSDTPPQAIIMNQVIEHLEDPAFAVAKAYEMLAPGGVLCVETPCVDSWDARLFRERYWGGWHTPRHWVLYEEKTLKALMRSRGFEVVETSYLLSPNFWLQSLHHLILERWRKPRVAAYFDVSFLPLLAIASGLDVIQRLVSGRTSNFRMVGRKPTNGGTYVP